jgi:hypothetical protein
MTLRAIHESQANALRFGVRRPSAALSAGKFGNNEIAANRSASGKFHGFLSADSKTPSKTLAIFI